MVPTPNLVSATAGGVHFPRPPVESVGAELDGAFVRWTSRRS